MNVPEAPEPEINWGYNCLTIGVHHGRPEQLWNLPLLQAYEMFGEDLKDLVVYRIYTDALIFVHRGLEPRPNKEWAEKVKTQAENLYHDMLQRKVDEIDDYYKSPMWKRDVGDVVERIKNNKLNPFYQPLHAHDSVNMLCRILGVSASQKIVFPKETE